MKGIFGRSTRPVGAGAAGSGAALASFAVPPFPQSTPDRLLSLHVCSTGLLLLPRPSSGASNTHSRTSSASSAAAAALGDAAPLATTDEARAQDVAHERRRDGAPTAGALIEWGRKGKVTGISARDAALELERSKVDAEGAETLCYGVVGILRVFNAAYLLVVVSRTHSGDFLHTSCPVYRSTGVLSIPLELARAREALHSEALRQAKVPAPRTDASTSDEESSDEESDLDDVHTPAPVDGAAAAAKAIGEAATLRPARSGPWLKRLAGRAASDGGAPGAEAAAEQTAGVDVPSAITPAVAAMFDPAGGTVSAVTADEAKEMTADERYHEASKAELEEKVVRETAKQYSRGEMWFAYDFDLTTPLQRKEEAAAAAGHARMSSASSDTRAGAGPPWDEPNQRLPLWRRADRRFWHNEHLSRDFVQAGLHGLVLPLMQGFFQIVPLPLGEAGADTPPKSPDAAGEAMDMVSQAAASERLSAYILLVSRRSKERAGLRYQRRGIADDGTVANYVETEQILLVKRPGSTHTLSFVQFRGSIPLFWSQNPFHLKPPPILERSAKDNTQACKRHFDEQTARYGSVTCINLAEQGGKEGQITEAYRQAAEAYGGQVQYVAFDFHKECAGMKFENVARLLERMKEEQVLGKMDCFWRTAATSGAGAQTLCKQQGAFRVSCLDCLDRTNVVQSAFARHMLGVQLERLGVAVPSLRGERDEAFDFAFNDSWANNGDMVSQIYAGTRALKGDFTRTGKRNLLGMMNDATASVYRMVQGAVTDFFKQTVMDFQYGQMSLAALERYNDELVAQDPSEHQKLARIRAHAIDNCAALVLADGETKLGGWTLFSPIEANRVQSAKLEEKVVLLTSKALYSCGWDFTAEKLVEFSRILLGDIVAIKKGVYIIAPKEAFAEENHWGLVISYLNEEKRLNTASMKNISPAQTAVGGATNFLAFRAVVDDFVGTLALPRLDAASSSSSAAAAAAAEKSGASSSGGGAGAAGGHKPKLLFRRGGGGGGAPTSAPMAARSVSASSMDALDGEVTSHKIVDRIVAILVARCAQAGACDADAPGHFVFEETIQSLAEARANASMFAPLIEGLKRRLWL